MFRPYKDDSYILMGTVLGTNAIDTDGLYVYWQPPDTITFWAYSDFDREMRNKTMHVVVS